MNFDQVLDSLLADYPELRAITSRSRYRTTATMLTDAVARGSMVVDLGAWPGALTCALQRLGYRVTAVDKDPSRPTTFSREAFADGTFGALRERTGSLDELCRREGVAMVVADLESSTLPIGDSSADAVLLTEVVEHLWQNPLFTLREINRVLRPGGVLLLSTPNLTSIRNRINFALGRTHEVIEHPFVAFLKRERVGHMGHLRLYAPEELTGMLALFGFDCNLSFVHSEASDQGDSLPPPARTSVSGVVSGSSTVTRVLRPLQKLMRPPSAYVDAALATAVALAEKRVPSLRSGMFIVGHKVGSGDLSERASEIETLVRRNR